MRNLDSCLYAGWQDTVPSIIHGRSSSMVIQAFYHCRNSRKISFSRTTASVGSLAAIIELPHTFASLPRSPPHIPALRQPNIGCCVYTYCSTSIGACSLLSVSNASAKQEALRLTRHTRYPTHTARPRRPVAPFSGFLLARLRTLLP